jgi:hypothetical protein
MNKLLALFAILEAITGLSLIIEPSFVARLLAGASVSGVGTVVGRVAGFALVSLGLACWPRSALVARHTLAVWAMLTYNLLVACYLTLVGIDGRFVGILLWPAVAIHGLLTLFLIRAWLMAQVTQDSKG